MDYFSYTEKQNQEYSDEIKGEGGQLCIEKRVSEDIVDISHRNDKRK